MDKEEITLEEFFSRFPISQRSLAKKANMSYSTISDLVNYKYKINDNHLQKLNKAIEELGKELLNIKIT